MGTDGAERGSVERNRECLRHCRYAWWRRWAGRSFCLSPALNTRASMGFPAPLRTDTQVNSEACMLTTPPAGAGATVVTVGAAGAGSAGWAGCDEGVTLLVAATRWTAGSEKKLCHVQVTRMTTPSPAKTKPATNRQSRLGSAAGFTAACHALAMGGDCGTGAAATRAATGSDSGCLAISRIGAGAGVGIANGSAGDAADALTVDGSDAAAVAAYAASEIVTSGSDQFRYDRFRHGHFGQHGFA